MYDPDLWQHLRVGRAIWESHGIPHTNVWTWPTYGESYVLPSWLFRAMLWPFFHLGGEWGLMVWRWGVTLATFAIAGLTARRMGARGLTVVIAIVWCALLFRLRSMVRPEMLACLLLAIQMWVLETRRHGGRDHSRWLVLVAWLWANVHVSYYLSLTLTGFHLLDELVAALRRRPGARMPVALAGVLAASAAACFVNPFGWAALWQPFQYFFEWRQQPLFQMILELRPIVWQAHESDGLLPWMLLAIGLALVRLARGRGNLVDALTYALFFATAIGSQRFLGFLCVAVAPAFARDAAEAMAAVKVPGGLRPAWSRAALASLVMVAGAVPQLSVEPWRPGFGFDWKAFPVRACDWMAAHGVRGRSFGAFHFAGYQLWRFWPERDRLPFMDIHQTGTLADQTLYAHSWSSPEAWQALDAKYRFDYVLLPAHVFPGQDLLDRMDADSTWSLVFLDDTAALYLRRDGPMAGLAARWRYAIVPAGDRAVPRMNVAFQQSPERRQQMRAELERQTNESKWTARANGMLATFDLAEHRWADAIRHANRAKELDRDIPGVDRIAQVAGDSLRVQPR
jgi:hypothetical protein